MANPVWVLSVDLQTKTATFQSGMGDAARSARRAFKDINEGAAEMGESVGRGSLDVRHALGLVDNTIRGAHTMAMADLIRMFKDSALVMGALPFAMTIAGFALVAEMVYKGVQAYEAYKQAQEKIASDSMKAQTSIQGVFNGLDDKIIESEKQVDTLRGDHLAALQKELELIDHQSMQELARSFDTVDKAAEKFLGDLKVSWYQSGIGSAGALHALQQFQTQYENYLALGNTGAASGLLAGTLAQAKLVLQMQQQAAANQATSNDMITTAAGRQAEYNRYEEAMVVLRKANVGFTDKEVQSQQELVAALSAQQEIEQKIHTLTGSEKTAAKLTAARDITRQFDQEDSKLRAGRDRYLSEIFKQYADARKTIEEGERANIEATESGSVERLAAIEEAITAENQAGLQGTDFYKQLLTERVNVTRQLSDEEARLRQEAAKETASHSQKMKELALAAEKERDALSDSSNRHGSDPNRKAAEAQKYADQEYAIKMEALEKQRDGLDTGAKDYQNRLKALQDQEKQLTQEHENEITAIRDRAEIERNQRVLAARGQFDSAIAQGLTQSIMGHETWSKMVRSVGDQVVGGMIQNAIKSMLADDMTKERDAASAARKAFNIGLHIGGPAGLILGPVFGAAAFSAVMAFEKGTERVPGVGHGDIVPAMLTPGEGVVPGGVMDGLRDMARNGGFNQHAPTIHLHFRPTYNLQALDGEGIDTVLEKHTDKLTEHFQTVLRKQNR